ncbi:MAG: SRPBCC family protein [Actinomycetes bacterium]
MKVTGSATLNAPREKVWGALNDPAVLARTIPGCLQLEEVGPDSYRMTITAGVASIKGTYQGDVALADQQQPGSFTLRASGAGAPGTVSADVKVTLAESDGTTRLDYDADAIVGGVIGGVGQRVLCGVAKKTAGEFFRNVDDVLTGKAPTVPTPRDETATGEVAAASPAGVPAGAAGRVFGPGAGAAATGNEFLKGAVFGAVVALAGVLVGSVVSRRRG